MADKVTENRLRRMAERQGLVVQKSRRRDPRATEFGMFFVSDPTTNVLDQRVDQQFGLTSDEVEALLSGEYDKPVKAKRRRHAQ